MSYILEALKKSEQERGHGGAPGIQTIHTSALDYRVNKKPLWPWLLLAALGLNLAVLVYFMLNRSGNEAAPALQPLISNTDSVPAAEMPATEIQPPATVVAAPVSKPKPVAAVTQRPASSADPATGSLAVVYSTADPAPAAAPVTVSAPAPVHNRPPNPDYASRADTIVLEIDELPPEIGRHVPRMEFSAHVYSDNPRQRSVIINGMFLEQGQPLSTDLILSEITSDGAIFDFRGYRFHRSVLAGWD